MGNCELHGKLNAVELTELGNESIYLREEVERLCCCGPLRTCLCVPLQLGQCFFRAVLSRICVQYGKCNVISLLDIEDANLSHIQWHSRRECVHYRTWL